MFLPRDERLIFGSSHVNVFTVLLFFLPMSSKLKMKMSGWSSLVSSSQPGECPDPDKELKTFRF